MFRHKTKITVTVHKLRLGHLEDISAHKWFHTEKKRVLVVHTNQ